MKQDGKLLRISKAIGNKSIKKQMYSVYFVAMVIPILLVGIFLVVNTYRQLTNYYSDMIASDNLRVKNILFQITTQVHNLSEDISFNNELQPVMTEKYNTTEQFRNAANKVTILDDYQSTYMELQSVEIYCDNPSVRNYKQFYRTTEEIEASDWYQRAVNQADVFWTVLSRTDNNGNVYWNLCLVRRLPLIGSKYHAVLVMRISEDYLRSGIGGSNFVNYVSANDAPVFYSDDRSAQGILQPVEIDYSAGLYSFSGRVFYNGNRSFAKISTFSAYQSESKIYICTLNSIGYSEIGYILLVCVIIIMAAILLPGILIYIFTGYFTGRIGVLRQDMHRASRRDYEIEEVFPGEDEISEAHRDLQIMVKNIKEQEAEVYEAKIKEQELEAQQRMMEYKHLASQINPHFLYNTLETIRMKAFTAGDKEVAGAIKLLGKSMRYVLTNTGNTETTLAGELENIRVYLDIQKMRFGDRFDCEIRVSEDIEAEKVSILPLMLQPIVENAVVHGMEALEGGGKILIEVYEGEANNIIIDVTDNGLGMDDNELAQLRTSIQIKDTSKSNSIGLYNINQRLILLYGREYSLIIDSIPGQGTRVRLRLPENKVYK